MAAATAGHGSAGMRRIPHPHEERARHETDGAGVEKVLDWLQHAAKRRLCPMMPEGLCSVLLGVQGTSQSAGESQQ